MITFRHHLVSLVAVFLALAVGVVLGAGPLVDVPGAGADEGESVSATSGDASPASQFADEFAALTASRVLHGVLQGTPVALVRMPGASKEAVAGLRASVKQAGGRVASVTRVLPTFTSPSEKSLVDTLGSQLREQVSGAGIPVETPTYARVGQLLARAIATSGGEPVKTDDTGALILDGLAAGKLVEVTQRPEVRAPLVLLVTGQPGQDRVASDAIWAGFVRGLSAGSVATVVAGPGQGKAPEALRRLHEETSVATVAGVGGAAGQVTAVLALDHVRDGGGTGAYGVGAPDGAVPVG